MTATANSLQILHFLPQIDRNIVQLWPQKIYSIKLAYNRKNGARYL